MKSSENTVLEANRGCARPGSNKYWECNCFTTGHLLSIKSEQTLNKVIYGHLQTMKDNTNLCPMCKLPVKALGTRKRDTRTASPAEGRASSWRQNKLLKPWQPTVLWDWEERVSVSWRNVFWGNKSWSTFWISVKFWSAGENSRRHCGQRQDGEIEMKEPWGQVRRHRGRCGNSHSRTERGHCVDRLGVGNGSEMRLGEFGFSSWTRRPHAGVLARAGREERSVSWRMVNLWAVCMTERAEGGGDLDVVLPEKWVTWNTEE